MDLKTAISLIQCPEIKSNARTTWTDLGCGSGLFTKALSTLLQSGSKIIAVDKDVSALKKVNVANGIILEKLHADFINDDLPLQNLNGILMANALHFVKDKNVFLQKLQSYVNETASFLSLSMTLLNPIRGYLIGLMLRAAELLILTPTSYSLASNIAL